MSPEGRIRMLSWLSFAIALLGGAAALGALVSQAEAQPVPFATARGQTVLLHGQGIYRYDSLFTAAGFRGQDWVTLGLGVPLLLGAALRHRRRPTARRLYLLLGPLAYFLYVYASMALAAAYNPLFLLYVALLSASFFALVSAFGTIQGGRDALAGLEAPDIPRRGPGVFMLASGAITAVVWLAPLLGALLRGQPPKLLDHYTTMVTYALDLAIVTPAAVLAGVLILRRRPFGYLLAAPLLGIVILLAPVIVAGTIAQRAAGIAFTAAEAVGPISGFVVLGGLGTWVLGTIARRLPDSPSPPPGSGNQGAWRVKTSTVSSSLL